MASGVRVEIRGAKSLARALGDAGIIDEALRPGFKKAAVIVEGQARADVHKVTRKLAGSLGHYLEGRGASLEAHIGPQPGLGQPRGYSESDTRHWKKPRRGRNTGDPTVYSLFEEKGTRHRAGHPFLEPALTDNIGRINDVIATEAAKVIERRF